jgi:hypothetical protein
MVYDRPAGLIKELRDFGANEDQALEARFEWSGSTTATPLLRSWYSVLNPGKPSKTHTLATSRALQNSSQA